MPRINFATRFCSQHIPCCDVFTQTKRKNRPFKVKSGNYKATATRLILVSRWPRHRSNFIALPARLKWQHVQWNFVSAYQRSSLQQSFYTGTAAYSTAVHYQASFNILTH